MRRTPTCFALPLLILVAACGLVTACGKDEADKVAVTTGAPVVLISIDTLRADRLPAYGYSGVETPAIDALRQDAILFRHAYAHVPLTLPSHASLLTGLVPAEHGLRDNVGYTLDAEAVAAAEIPYLPHLLKTRGYATGGAVSSFVLRAQTGIATGFDFYEDNIEFHTRRGLGGLQRPGGETLERAGDWLQSVRNTPFFFFFHIYEPHTPYEPPEPYAARYGANAYDGEIAAADHIIGALLAELKRLGVYDNAIIILLSDHGEGLGDHGEEEHGVLLYQEAIRVPLILKLPGGTRAGSTVEAPAQLLDVFPTLVDLLDLPRPTQLTGMSLLDLMVPEPPARRLYAETFYPRLHFGWSELTSLIDDQYHYIEGPDPELYDLKIDPGETQNRLGEARRVYATMRDQLAAFDRSLAAPGEADEETRANLVALGYVGSAAPAGDGPLLDPKSQLDTLKDLKRGFQYNSRGDYRQAAEAFHAVLVKNPGMLDAWEFLARAYQQLGAREEALAAFEEALRLSNGAPHIAISAATLFFELGRLDDAEAHAELAIKSHPTYAHGLLARIALERGELELAEREARTAMGQEKGLRLGPKITLAEVLHAAERSDEALTLLDETEAAYGTRQGDDPELIQGLYRLRGSILADRGEAEAAEVAFKQEIALFPHDHRAYSHLAVLYALIGRGNEVGLLLQSMVEAQPSASSYAEAVRTLRILQDEASASALLQYALGLFPNSKTLRDLAATG